MNGHDDPREPIAPPRQLALLRLEIFEIATLKQTEKIRQFPVVTMGTEYWKPLAEFIRGTMIAEGALSLEEIHPFFTDSPKAAVAHVRKEVG